VVASEYPIYFEREVSSQVLKILPRFNLLVNSETQIRALTKVPIVSQERYHMGIVIFGGGRGKPRIQLF
jgi:hypothetical protein